MNTMITLPVRQYDGYTDLITCDNEATLTDIFNIWLKSSNCDWFEPNLHEVWFNIGGKTYGRLNLNLKINTIPFYTDLTLLICIISKRK